MNETRRNGALRLYMLEEFPGEACRAPLYVPGKRTCSTSGCGAILSGYNRSDVCSICRSKQLSGEFERAAQAQARKEKTMQFGSQKAYDYAVQQGLSDGLLRLCACGCGEIFRVLEKPGRQKIYASANCSQNARNRQKNAYRERLREAR